MPERVLPNPLSGEEVVRAILDKVGNSLRRDCFLSPNLSYDYFTCEVKLSVRCHDVGRTAEVNVAETVAGGEIEESEDAALEAADAEFQIEAAPPNEVRVDTGQEVPVLTKRADGKPEVRQVRYSKKKLAEAK